MREGLVLSAEYSTPTFERSTIERMLRHFQTLLAGIVEDADRSILALQLMGDAEQRQVVERWNTTVCELADAGGVQRLFEAQASRQPDAPAVVDHERCWTYGELDRRANQLARHLQANGVGSESRVGICLDRSCELVMAVLGVLKAGGSYVPLDPAYLQVLRAGPLYLAGRTGVAGRDP